MRTLKLNNLRKQVKNEINGYKKGRLEQLEKSATIEEIRNNWQLKDYLTATTKRDDYFSNVQLMKSYLKDRIVKAYDKKINNKIQEFDSILNSGVLVEAVVSVTWAKSRTWGANPKAEIKGTYKDLNGQNKYFFYEGSSVSGCGYDKLSTAVSEVLNQVKPIKRALYIKKNAKATEQNKDIFSYGSGCGVLPYIEGGVGVSCYPSIFANIGCKFETVASGKMFDVFKITKK